MPVTDTTTSNTEATKIKVVVEPLIDLDNNQPIRVKVRGAGLPCISKTTLAHTRKVQGAVKNVEETVEYRAAIDAPMNVVALAQAALMEAPEADRLPLAEKIFGNWLTQAAARAYVPSQLEPGAQVWDENAYAKALCSPTAPRKAGVSIDDLRKEREDINAIMVPLLEIIMTATSTGEEPNYAEAAQIIGREFTELEAMIEYRIQLKERLQNLTASIKVKEDSMAKARANKAAKKAEKKDAPSAVNTAASNTEANVQH